MEVQQNSLRIIAAFALIGGCVTMREQLLSIVACLALAAMNINVKVKIKTLNMPKQKPK